LLTIHKAKGLQFDTVIVPSLDRRARRDDPRLLHWARLPGVEPHDLVIAPVAGAGEDANRLYAWLATLESKRLQHERCRLLYVAATRAERWLHLFGACALKEGESGVTIVRPGTSVALGMLWPAVGPEFSRRLAELGIIEGEARPVVSREPRLRRLPEDWKLPDVVAPLIQATSAARAAPAAIVDFDWATETARHVGTVVHRELQRLARTGRIEVASDETTRRRYSAALAELGVPDDRRDAAVGRIETALRRTLDDPRGRWLLDPGHAAAENELALSGILGGEIASVVIDRTFVDAEGTRWIVDYKTSSHEGADLEGFLDSEQERYRPQLQRYAEFMRRLGPEPVRLGLYFPLLSAWREWR
jgi:ATP-dependent exoDNAse (exonuclease V) beta subunit